MGAAWQAQIQGATTHWIAPDVRHVVFDPTSGVVLFAAESGKSHLMLKRPDGGPYQPVVFFSSNGIRVFAGLVGKDSRSACVWNVEAAKATPLPPEMEFDEGSCFSPDGSRLVLLGSKVAQLLDANTGTVLAAAIPNVEPDGPTFSSGYHAAHFSPDGGRLLLAANFYNERSDRRTDPRSAFRVFGVNNLARAQSLGQAAQPLVVPLADQVNLPAAMNPAPHARPAAAFSPDGQMVLTVLHSFAPHAEYVGWGRPFGEARTWNAQTGEPLSTPLRHAARCEAVFSPQGDRVLTAGEDGVARIWDARSGAPLTSPMKHHLAVGFAEFSTDGRRVLTAGSDHVLRVWGAATGEAISPPLRRVDASLSPRLAPDGLSVVAVAQRSVILWRLRSDDRPLDELASYCSRLALHRLDQFGAYVPIEP
jgi:WD40 repeat protein